MKKLLLVIFIVLTSCNLSGCKDKAVHESIYGELPTFNLTEEEFEENMFEYATTISQMTISKLHWRFRYDEIVIGERIPTYGYENGELIELQSPYYFPVFLDGMPIQFVEVYNGVNSPYVPIYFGGNINTNFSSVDNNHFFWRTDDYFFERDNKESADLINGMFLVMSDQGSVYVSKNYIIERYSMIDIEEEKLKTIRENMSEYKTYPLNREYKTNDEVHIIENITSDDLIANNKEYLLSEFKRIAPNQGINYKTIKVGEPFKSYLCITNIDLSTSFIQDADYGLIYPIFVDGKYYCDAVVCYFGDEMTEASEDKRSVFYYVSGITDEEYNQFKSQNEYVLFHDYTYYSRGILSKKGIITTGAGYYDEKVITKLQEVLN
ncbi:MAG: hypothetical protein Q4C64_04510 [Erysipelotrichia bacterium]|nr:hypothetical protein [Erysipelotrichia bacterium]